MRSDDEIRRHMDELERESREASDGRLFAACANTRIDFIEKPDGVYGNVYFCTFKRLLDCDGPEHAAQMICDLNEQGGICPECGKPVRYQLCTTDDFKRREDFGIRREKEIRR